MGKYILYLDESETFNGTKRFFSVGGVIINKDHVQAITNELNQLKKNLWPNESSPENFILHEKEISEAKKSGRSAHPYNIIFRQNQQYKTLYAGLAKILKRHDITTIATCVNISSLQNKYPGEVNPNLTIALQMLLENYCHFLTRQNSCGDVCYESLQESGNTPLRQRFYELQALGTMYYTSHTFQTHIGDINFIDKSENLAGLQLADFIPNTYARKVAGLKPKHNDFKKAVFSTAYDGGLNDTQKYGLKEIP